MREGLARKISWLQDKLLGLPEAWRYPHAQKLIRLAHMIVNAPDNEYTWRYAVGVHEWELRQITHEVMRAARGEGHEDLPEWLVPIVDAAVVGGHIKRLGSAPDALSVVWFVTNDQHELIKYLEI